MYLCRRRQKECGEKSFSNSIYNIDFMCDIKKQFPIFGAKYNFHLEGVVDCPEFLVYFPVLEKSVIQLISAIFLFVCFIFNVDFLMLLTTFRLAKSCGLELKMKMTFAEYFEKHSNLDTGFLNRITALEVLD